MSTGINYRPHGYVTEKIGAQDVAKRAPTQRERLLMAYADQFMGLTDEQAADAAGLLRSCYWKRCGELRALGLITTEEVDGKLLTRRGSAGTERIICWITEEGESHLDGLSR